MEDSTLNSQQLQTVEELCAFVIQLQKSGKFVSGHVPRSGVFADCSLACEPRCLSVKAQKLLKELRC